MSSARYRILACVPTTLSHEVEAAFPRERFEATVTADARTIRAAAMAGNLNAVVLHEAFGPPAPSDLARALRAALPAGTAIILLTHDLPKQSHPNTDASIRFPAGPGVVADRTIRTIAATRSGARPDDRELAANVEVQALGLETQTHYEVLGVAQGAPHDAIVEAYDQLSLRFHPDRLRSLTNASIRELGTRLYIRIGEAYRTLRSRSTREAYDESLRGGSGIATEVAGAAAAFDTARALEEISSNPRAKRHLRLAQQALATGDHGMLLLQLRFAASQEPDNGLIATRLREMESRFGDMADS
jgi:hypothetical protein